MGCCGLAPAGNKRPCSCSTTSPSTRVWRRMERTRQIFMGRDKGSLTEQRTKQTVTTIILIERIYKTSNEMHRATLTT